MSVTFVNLGGPDVVNVTAAGALMDSEVDADIKTLSLPASTTITAAAATVLDDASVAAMVNTLGGATSTGSGGIARATSATLVTPALGTPSALVATNATGTAANLTVGATTGVEAGADVTDATNVAAAGAAMTDAVITSAAGSAGAPGFTFNGDSNTGTYSVGADSLGISTGGTVRRTISDTVETTTLPQRAASAAASAPAYSFTSDTDTGMYLNGAGNLAFSVGNGTRRTITATAETFTMPQLGPDGSAAAPGYSFSGDGDTGMYRVSANRLGFSCGGSFRLLVDPSGLVTFRNDSDLAAGNVYGTTIQMGVSDDATNPGTADYFTLLRRGDGTTIGSIRGTGSASVSYLTTSDATLKTDNGIVTSERIGGIIDGLEVHDFDWIDGDVSDQIGLFAQQAIDILPDTIVTPPGVEPGDDDGEPERYLAASLDYSKIVPILVAECQFLRQRLNTLESAA